MYAYNLSMHLVRALARPRLAAGLLVGMALLPSACKDQDPVSRINAPALVSSSALASVLTSASASAPSLGLAANFAALGGTGVTCTMPNPPLPAVTISGGDVGSLSVVSTTVTGFPGFTPGANPCSLSGSIQLGATAAFANFVTAYNTLAGIPCPTDAPHLLSGDLGGMTLSPGVYCISGVGLLTSQLTLNGGANQIWIFKAASSITPIGGSVVMAGGGSACNVYWELGTAASFDNTDFAGNVLAGTAITFTGNGSSLVGRALAKSDVTLTGANIAACAGSNGGGKGHHGKGHGKGHDKDKCNQGVGNGREDCDPGNSNHRHGSNDEDGGSRGDPGRKGGH